MKAPALVCAGMEVALNRYLGLEPAVLAECAQLAGRTLALELSAPAWELQLEFHAGGVRVLGGREAAADVTVRGPASVLARLGWQAAHGAGGLPQGLEIEGDSELLSRFNRMLGRVGFDAEEFFARFFGDAAGHRVAQGVQQLLKLGRDTARTLGLDTAEYLREETRDLARGSDVEEWMDAVDDLRDAVDRLQARIERAEARAAS